VRIHAHCEEHTQQQKTGVIHSGLSQVAPHRHMTNSEKCVDAQQHGMHYCCPYGGHV
jgi:hypothetical protein